MFRIKEIVKPSGKGQTAAWPEQAGTETRVTAESALVQCELHHSAYAGLATLTTSSHPISFASKPPLLTASPRCSSSR